MNRTPTPYHVAQMLLRIRAVVLRPDSPFRYASGLLSPIYCDNRIIISFPEERRQVACWFAQLLSREGISVDVIAGTATGGIPHAAWLAAETELPMVYVRSGAKDHGRGQSIEGVLSAGQRVVVVEDLVTTGGSSLGTVTALREAGGEVGHVLTIFSYDLDQVSEAFLHQEVQLHPLTTLPVLLDVAVEEGFLTSGERSVVEQWAADPAGWSAAREQVLAQR